MQVAAEIHDQEAVVAQVGGEETQYKGIPIQHGRLEAVRRRQERFAAAQANQVAVETEGGRVPLALRPVDLATLERRGIGGIRKHRVDLRRGERGELPEKLASALSNILAQLSPVIGKIKERRRREFLRQF